MISKSSSIIEAKIRRALAKVNVRKTKPLIYEDSMLIGVAAYLDEAAGHLLHKKIYRLVN